MVLYVTEHNCGGYCQECATELWESTPQKDKVFFMRMRYLYDRYMDIVNENPDGWGSTICDDTTQKFITAMEIMELDCGMDDK